MGVGMMPWLNKSDKATFFSQHLGGVEGCWWCLGKLVALVNFTFGGGSEVLELKPVAA